MISTLVPKLQSFLTTPKTSYLNRMCVIHSLMECAKYLDTKQNTEFILPIIIKGMKDKIANVRFYTVKITKEKIYYSFIISNTFINTVYIYFIIIHY